LAPVFPGSLGFSDFTSFILYVRQDPNFPRQTTAALQNAQLEADPVNEGWSLVLTLSGTPNSGAGTVSFTIASNAGLLSGSQRYVLEMVGSGGDAGIVQLYPQSWCSVYPQ
jgi:hypothetical protein